MSRGTPRDISIAAMGSTNKLMLKYYRSCKSKSVKVRQTEFYKNTQNIHHFLKFFTKNN